MNRTEALSILGTTVDELDVIKEAYDLEIFNLIQLFLKDPVVPNLIEAKKKKIALIGEAWYNLTGLNTNEISNLELTDLRTFQCWDELLKSYESNKAKLRYSISNCKSAQMLILVLDQLKENEFTYAKIMTEKLSAIPREEIKMSELITLLAVKIELNKLLEQGSINKSVDSLVNITANMNIFNLSKEINRLRKIIE